MFLHVLFYFNCFLLNFFNYSFKSFRMVHCKVGKSFSVKCNSFFSNFPDKFRIAHIVLTYTGINPLNP